MQYMIKDLMRRKVIPAMLSIALGIVIIIARRSAVDLLVRIMGGLVITCGFAFVAIYLTRPDPERGNLSMVLVMAAAAMIAGLLMIHYAEIIVNFFPTLMGIFLILNGLSHLTAAGVEKEYRIPAVITGALVILFGLVLVAQPGFIVNAIMIWIGAFFIANGLMDLILVKRMNRIFR